MVKVARRGGDTLHDSLVGMRAVLMYMSDTLLCSMACRKAATSHSSPTTAIR